MENAGIKRNREKKYKLVILGGGWLAKAEKVLNNKTSSKDQKIHHFKKKRESMSYSISVIMLSLSWTTLNTMGVFHTEGGDAGCKISFEGCNSD